ncbi:MAG: hypothetical protein ACJ8EL_01065 [Rhizomicrobium sp.]
MKIGHLLLAASAGLVLAAHPASARTLQVGTCKDAQVTFSTIQEAIDVAFVHDKITVCPGNYPEQVVITKTLTLTNVKGFDNPVITVPAGGVVQNTTTLSGFPTAAQVLVQPDTTANVTVRNIVVDGADNNVQTCGLQLVGVYYRNAGGTIQADTIKNQLLPEGYQGCQSGLGIYVQNANAGTDPVVITANSVTNFNKNGITMNEAAATGEITRNTVVGMGPTDVIAQNGIQVAYGANADVETNSVSNLIYSPGTYGAAGILLYGTDASTSIVNHNTMNSAQYGAVLDAVNGTAGNRVQVTTNKIYNAQFAGVGLYSDGPSDDYINVSGNNIQNTSDYDGIDACSDNNTITNNKMVNSSGESAIHLDGLCAEPDNSQSGKNNTVSGNRVTNACVGVLSGPAEGENTVGTNKYNSVQHQIVYGQDSYSCGPHHAPARHHAPKHSKGGPVPGAISPVRR